MNPRIWYFCHICDNYRNEGCSEFNQEVQEGRVNKGSCGSAEIHGRPVEIYEHYVHINGISFRRGSKDLIYVLEQIRLLQQKQLKKTTPQP